MRGDNWVGGIVGHLSDGGSVLNCSFSGTVKSENKGNFAGGIVGALVNASIKGCSSSGSVTAGGKYSNVGGIAGYNADNGEISKCSNTATVTAAGESSCVGGIEGVSDSGSLYCCYNQGDVGYIGTENNREKVGGIAGLIHAGWFSVTVRSCYSTGTVSANGENYGTGAKVGGTVGGIKVDSRYTVTIEGGFTTLSALPQKESVIPRVAAP